MSLVEQATQYMIKRHKGQYRRGLNIPYSTHLFGVARILKAAGYEEQLVVVGLLHDLFEETDATEQEVATLFGQQVVDLIAAVSEPDGSKSWLEHKQYVINQIKYLSEGALAVVLAEKLQNVRAIKYELSQLGEATWQNFNAGKEQQQWYYQSILEQTKKYHPRALLLPELEEAIYQLFVPINT